MMQRNRDNQPRANKARLDNRWAALSAMPPVTLTRYPVSTRPPPQRCQRLNFRQEKNSTIKSAVIDDRLQVWEALSDFFLDTELEENDYQRISEVLASSPYAIQDIEDILRFEVYPVLIWNLRSVAGEWAGFDRDWLQEQVEPRLNKRPKFRMPMLQWGMIRGHWRRVSTIVRDSRKELVI